MNRKESPKSGRAITRIVSSISAIWWIVLCSGVRTLSYGQTAQPVEIKQSKERSSIVQFDSDRWYLSDKSEFVSFGGRKALAGTAYMKDVDSLNGTIEVDIWITGGIGFAGFMFRVQSFEEYEWCWLRTHKTNGIVPDGLQYAPAFKGATCWQLNGGSGGIGAVNVPKNEWVHMRIEGHDESAALYVKDIIGPTGDAALP